MIRVKCSNCGKEFYCNGDKICTRGVHYSQTHKKMHPCYCKECTRRQRLDTEKGIRECDYRTVEEMEPETVNFT